MNTANLQLEGLYAAIAALMTALRVKGVLNEAEIEAALSEAENALAVDPQRPTELSPAHLAAVQFPLRYLRLANRVGADGAHPSFSELAAGVGRGKQ